MNLHRNPIASAIASILACSMLAACGGGSAGGGQLRVSATSPPPPTRPPPPPPACPMPITGDCTVNHEGRLLGGRNSSGAFVLALPPPTLAHTPTLFVGSHDDAIATDLRQATYTFAGGTEIRSGALWIERGNSWVSDVALRPMSPGAAHLWVNGLLVGNLDNRQGGVSLTWAGTIRGHVENAGWFHFSGAVEGNVANHADLYFSGGSVGGNVLNTGLFHVDLLAPKPGEVHVRGNLTLDAGGVFAAVLAPKGVFESGVPFTVQGRADLAGLLALYPAYDGWGGAALPGIGSHRLLHASDGVFGTFARWEGRELFLTGQLRYEPNDVWFDLQRVSFSAAMASSGQATPLTLASADNLERALSFAEGNPRVATVAQGQFLANTGRLLWLDDGAQAARTLDSLAGAAHADAVQSTLQQGIGNAPTSQRLAAMQAGAVAGAWTKASATDGTSGFDHWLSPRLLAGVAAGQGVDATKDVLGQANRATSHSGAYLRWFGDNGWYAGGSAGYAQHIRVLDRPLDLGRGGQWNAHSRQRFHVAGLQGEAGRQMPLGGGTLTPYVSLEASALRSERSIEQGGTGFELALLPTMRANLGATLGLRYGRDWRLGETGWLRLDADARIQRRLADAGDPLRAAFVGVPDLWFDVPGHPTAAYGWLDLGLRGGFTRAWGWSFEVARPSAGSRAGMAARLGVQRSF